MVREGTLGTDSGLLDQIIQAMRVQLPKSGALATVDENCPQDVLDTLDKLALKVKDMSIEELRKSLDNQSITNSKSQK